MTQQPAFWPRINRFDWREIERAIAGDLFSEPLLLDGAMIEATFAATDPPLLRSLAEAGVPFVIDPQSLRFASASFLDIGHFDALPYRPDAPITPETADRSAIERLARGSLEAQASWGAAMYMHPAVPIRDLDEWQRLNSELLEEAASANGRDVDFRPLIGVLAPMRKLLATPDTLIKSLVDLPVEAVYVQPLILHPGRDGIEQLVQYCRFLAELKSWGLRVMAGRVGAFGLVLHAMGVDVTDSGPGEAESFNLAQLNRPRRKNKESSNGGGRRRRVYIEPLKTTLIWRDAEAVLTKRGLRARFACDLPCCRFWGFEDIASRRRAHYLWARTREMNRLRASPTSALRSERVHEDLLAARDHSKVVRRALAEEGLPELDFGHLDRWLGVQARLSAAAALA